MIRILVLSDTHIPVMADKLPQRIKEEAEKCDLCIHSGDFVEYSVFKELSESVKTYGVRGNMDSEEIQKNLPEKQIINVEGANMGITHGKGGPSTLIQTINSEFKEEGDKIDVFIFGHSHRATAEYINGKLYFNPGSATDRIFAPYKSYGILTVDKGKVTPEIVRWDHYQEE